MTRTAAPHKRRCFFGLRWNRLDKHNLATMRESSIMEKRILLKEVLR